MQRILLATGNEGLDRIIETKVAPAVNGKIVGSVLYKKDLRKSIENLEPDIVIISKLLTGTDRSIIDVILEAHIILPKARIIYLAGDVALSNQNKSLELATLVSSGIYDIITSSKISKNVLIDIILNPKVKKDVEYLIKGLKTGTIDQSDIVSFEEEVQDLGDIKQSGYKNIVLVSSIKPGTGKSFVSTNLATAIARFGVKKKNGERPKVALIEGDLQTLSVGTLLGYSDDEKLNLKTAMDRIAKILVNGELVDDELLIRSTNDFIRTCFRKYDRIDNLYALTGSHLRMDELDEVKPEYYFYLLSVIKEYFDVVILDCNSSLVHVSSGPLLELCGQAYFILNLDFNNVRNNKRYQKTLQDLGILDKVQYVLNEDMDKEYRALMGQEMLEPLQFDSSAIEDFGFNVISKIPEIPKEIFLNRLYRGLPIILDETDFTLKARIEISKIANSIWTVDNFDWLQKEFDRYQRKVNKVAAKRGRLFGANKDKE